MKNGHVEAGMVSRASTIRETTMNNLMLVMDRVECLTDFFKVGYITKDVYIIDSLNKVHGPYKDAKAVTCDVACCTGEAQAQIFVDKLGNKTRDESVYTEMLTKSILVEMDKLENGAFKNLLKDIKQKNSESSDSSMIYDYEMFEPNQLVQYNVMGRRNHAILVACFNTNLSKIMLGCSMFMIKDLSTGKLLKEMFYGRLVSVDDYFVIEDKLRETKEVFDSKMQPSIQMSINTVLKNIVSDTICIASSSERDAVHYVLKKFDKKTLKIGVYSDTFTIDDTVYRVLEQSTPSPADGVIDIHIKDMKLLSRQFSQVKLSENIFRHEINDGQSEYKIYVATMNGIHMIISVGKSGVALLDIARRREGLLSMNQLEVLFNALHSG